MEIMGPLVKFVTTGSCPDPPAGANRAARAYGGVLRGDARARTAYGRAGGVDGSGRGGGGMGMVLW